MRKQLYLVRKGRNLAAVMLQKMVRGFLQRRSYKIRWQVTVRSAVLLQRGECVTVCEDLQAPYLFHLFGVVEYKTPGHIFYCFFFVFLAVTKVRC